MAEILYRDRRWWGIHSLAGPLDNYCSHHLCCYEPRRVHIRITVHYYLAKQVEVNFVLGEQKPCALPSILAVKIKCYQNLITSGLQTYIPTKQWFFINCIITKTKKRLPLAIYGYNYNYDLNRNCN